MDKSQANEGQGFFQQMATLGRAQDSLAKANLQQKEQLEKLRNLVVTVEKEHARAVTAFNDRRLAIDQFMHKYDLQNTHNERQRLRQELDRQVNQAVLPLQQRFSSLSFRLADVEASIKAHDEAMVRQKEFVEVNLGMFQDQSIVNQVKRMIHWEKERLQEYAQKIEII